MIFLYVYTHLNMTVTDRNTEWKTGIEHIFYNWCVEGYSAPPPPFYSTTVTQQGAPTKVSETRVLSAAVDQPRKERNDAICRDTLTSGRCSGGTTLQFEWRQKMLRLDRPEVPSLQFLAAIIIKRGVNPRPEVWLLGVTVKWGKKLLKSRTQKPFLRS
jgi:hypothetical protein